jgi:hypothetical protein
VRRAIWGLTAAIAPRRPAPSPLAVRHAMPAVFESRDFIAAGGLMSYGGSLYRLRGLLAVPGPVVGRGSAGPDLGERWPSRLVATAAENRLNLRHSARDLRVLLAATPHLSKNLPAQYPHLEVAKLLTYNQAVKKNKFWRFVRTIQKGRVT